MPCHSNLRDCYTSRFQPAGRTFSRDGSNVAAPRDVSVSMNDAASTPVTVTCPVTALPDDPVVLKRMLEELLVALQQRDRELHQLQARLDQVLRRLFGPRAERLDPSQLL